MDIETAPKDGTKIKTRLTCLSGSIVSWWAGNYEGWHGWAITPSHWKPLNSKPNADVLAPPPLTSKKDVPGG